MKGKLLLILFNISGLISNGQSVLVDTLKFSTVNEIMQPLILSFPVVRADNEKISAKINQDLKNSFAGSEKDNPIADSIFIKQITENFTNLDFKVTFNKNGIISLNITAEGCGAYCTTWTEYFNYSTITGNSLEVNDLIDFSHGLKNEVIQNKTSQYEREREALERMRGDANSGLDEETYKWASEYYDGCESSFEVIDIALHDDYLEIIHECHLPRMIRALTPAIELKYKYHDIKEFLKIKTGK